MLKKKWIKQRKVPTAWVAHS